MAGQEALPRIDHIIIGAQDLKAAVDHFYTEYGLAAYHGGKHQVGTEFRLCRASEQQRCIHAISRRAELRWQGV